MVQKSIEKPQYKKLRILISFIILVLLIIQALLLISLTIQYWLLDIYVSFLPQILIVSGFILIVLLACVAVYSKSVSWNKFYKSLSKKELSSLAIALVLLVSVGLYSHKIIEPKPVSGRHNLVVGTYNVLYTNDQIDEAAGYFKSMNTDILAMQEARPDFVETARKIMGYDYKAVSDCDCSAGDTEVAIVSRYPLTNAKTIIEHQNGGVLRAEATLDDGKKVAVYAVHIPPPYSSEWYNLRNDFTETLTNAVNQDELDVVMLGDFNTTIFSPSMRGLISGAEDKVANTSENSWPECSWFGYGLPTCVRIDHIYVSNNFEIDSRYIGDGFGSDHRPVIAELQIN